MKLIEKALEGKLTDHITYKKNEQNAVEILDNYRSDSSLKNRKQQVKKLKQIFKEITIGLLTLACSKKSNHFFNNSISNFENVF